MKFSHPLWLAGFRPFFILTIAAGALLPILWVGIYAGALVPPGNGLSAFQWHAHEMLFGFGWAILGGFLLTSTKNWVGVRGIHGGTLATAALLWVIERFAIYFYGVLPLWLQGSASFAFIVYVSGYIAWTLVKFRKTDSYRDNFVFLIVLALFIIAKKLMLSEQGYAWGFPMAIGLFRVAFVMMFERTLPQFMKNGLGIQLWRNKWLDSAIKVFAIASVFEAFVYPTLAAGILALTGILLGFRFMMWKPIKGFSNFGIGLSYFGYLALAIHFLLEALRVSDLYNPPGSLAIHVFTFLCMGIVIPGMIIRISQGHTGRKLLFASSDRVAISFMGIAAFFRLGAVQIWPNGYVDWILFAAVAWSLAFILIGYRLIPFLLKARLDGREH